MKFKIGDEVTIRENIACNDYTIYEISEIRNKLPCYRVLGDINFLYNDEDLIPVNRVEPEEEIYCTCKRCECCGKIVKED